MEQALAIARARSFHRSIEASTKGIIFLGTPHRGSSKAEWARIGGKLLNLFSQSTGTTQASKELEEFSNVLNDYNSDFVNIASNYTIVSFYEKKDTGVLGLVRSEISRTEMLLLLTTTE